MSRIAFFKKLGAEYANSRWSWCAVNHVKREVYFGMWDVETTGSSGRILSTHWEKPRGRRQAGYTDAVAKLKLVENDGYKLKAFRMIQGQLDRSQAPSKIREIDETLVPARLYKTDVDFFAIFDDSEDELAEVLDSSTSAWFPEGGKRSVTINAFERNPAARRACIDHFGYCCQACGLDFASAYGELGKGFIHVHHKMPIATFAEQYELNPIQDLVPLCPNCHAMVHRVSPPMDVVELRALIESEMQGKIK